MKTQGPSPDPIEGEAERDRGPRGPTIQLHFVLFSLLSSRQRYAAGFGRPSFFETPTLSFRGMVVPSCTSDKGAADCVMTTLPLAYPATSESLSWRWAQRFSKAQSRPSVPR